MRFSAAILCAFGATAAFGAAEVKVAEVPGLGGMAERIGYWEVDSGKPGPVFAVVAAQHGNELCGCVSVRDFIRIAETNLVCGKVIGVPFMNPPAVRRRAPSADLRPGEPYIRSAHNMQTLWDSPGFNDTAALAAGIWEKILSRADCILDIHCYQRSMAPVAAVRNTPEGEALAKASGYPFVRTLSRESDWQGHLRVRAEKAGKRFIGIELRGQYLLYPEEIARGTRTAVNVARHLGLMPGKPETQEQRRMGGTVAVCAPTAGLFVNGPFKPGDVVRKGEKLGYVLRETTLEEVPVIAPVSGRITRFVGRGDGDVDIREFSQWVFLDDLVAQVLPD